MVIKKKKKKGIHKNRHFNSDFSDRQKRILTRESEKSSFQLSRKVMRQKVSKIKSLRFPLLKNHFIFFSSSVKKLLSTANCTQKNIILHLCIYFAATALL